MASYIPSAHIDFNLPWAAAYVGGGICVAAYVALLVRAASGHGR